MKKFDIIINTAMRDNPVAVLLDELGIEAKYVSLRQGEFIVSSEVGIKYLTRENYISGLKSRTIYRDIIEFKREFSKPLVIIEGDPEQMAAKTDTTQMHTAILFISVLNRIPVIFTANEMESAQLIFMMSAQADAGLVVEEGRGKTDGKHAGETAGSNGDLKRHIVENIPEVGPSLAKALLKHFGSLSNLFKAEIKDLRKVKGVGLRKAQAIHKFFNNSPAA